MQNIARASLSTLVVLALLAVGCGSGSDLGSDASTQTGTSAPEVGGTVRVVMKSLDFTPTVVKAKIGQRVVWTNEDSAPHNVTYVSGPRFKSSRTMIPGATFSVKLTEPGTIHYYCSIHPWMKATIDVSQ
jgi:plastocyanin